MVDRRREPVLAQAAMRQAIDRALAARLTSTELRVLLALVRLIPLFDRLEDHVSTAQVTELTGVDARHVRRALRRLDELGVIEREPGKGRTASLVRLSLDTEGADSTPSRTTEEGAGSAPAEGAGYSPRTGGGSRRREGADSVARGGASAPASESLPEVPSEARGESLLSESNAEMRGELRGILARLDADFGRAIVDQAIEKAGAGGLTYRWPSTQLQPALRTLCERLTPGRLGRPIGCDRCRDTRWDPDAWDDAANAPMPCTACCSTEAA